MEKFCLHVSGTVNGDDAKLEGLDIEGNGVAIMSSLAYVICHLAEDIDVAEDVILGDLGRFIKLSKKEV